MRCSASRRACSFRSATVQVQVRNCDDLLLFSVAGRRPCLASFLWSPLRAKRGSGARSDRRRARDARGARVHHGWLSPPQSSRGVRALCWSSPLPLLFVSVAPRVPLPRSTRAGGWCAHYERARGARRTQRTARRARRMGSPSAARSRSTRSAFAGSRQTAVLLGFAPRAPAAYLKEKGNLCSIPRCGVAGFVVVWAFLSKCPRSVLGGQCAKQPACLGLNTERPVHRVFSASPRPRSRAALR